MCPMFRRLARYCYHIYIPQLNNIPIENNYADISLKEIRDAYFTYGKWRKPHQKRIK